jgi:hypothetical protein
MPLISLIQRTGKLPTGSGPVRISNGRIRVPAEVDDGNVERLGANELESILESSSNPDFVVLTHGALRTAHHLECLDEPVLGSRVFTPDSCQHLIIRDAFVRDLIIGEQNAHATLQIFEPAPAYAIDHFVAAFSTLRRRPARGRVQSKTSRPGGRCPMPPGVVSNLNPRHFAACRRGPMVEDAPADIFGMASEIWIKRLARLRSGSNVWHDCPVLHRRQRQQSVIPRVGPPGCDADWRPSA